MYTVVNDIKSSFTVFLTFLTVITTKVKAYERPTCSNEELMKCSKPLSVLDSGLNFVSTRADLDRICPDLKEAIRCIHRFSRYCMSPGDKKHFHQLFHGTGTMVRNLCQNETYQEEYLRHAPCMNLIEPQTEVCFKRYTRRMNDIQSSTPASITDLPGSDAMVTYQTFQKRKRDAADEGIKNVCCSLQEYIECSTQTTRRTCGDDAAEFSKDFLEKMSAKMIQMHCQNYGWRECGLISSANISQNSILTLLVISVLALILR